MDCVSLVLNGQPTAYEGDATRDLLDWLRTDRGLTASRFGCGQGHCGACNVLVDGRVASACITPMGWLDGKRITTLEGLGDAARPHPLQEAFIAEQAMQCGYCISGIIISAAALLQANPSPNDTEIGRRSTAISAAAVLTTGSCGPCRARRKRCAARPRLTESPSAMPLPGSLAAEPRLSRWLAFAPDGSVTLSPGKVELGQGLLAALAGIAASELGLPPSAIRFRPATTGISPDEGVTSGSLSVGHCGMAVRQAAAEARALFVAEAARRFDCPAEAITIEDGVLQGPGNLRLGYGELAASVSLDRKADGFARPLGRVTASNASRPDTAGRVFGTRPFIHDITWPDILHGRVLRPARVGASLAAVDEAAFRAAHPGAVLVRDGAFLGVVCANERAAERALATLARLARWEGGVALPDPAGLDEWLLGAETETEIVATRGEGAAGENLVTRRYLKPFLAHGSIAPSCAIAQWRDGKLSVLSHTQGVYNLRSDLALVFSLPREDIVVEHAEGAGCYGHNGADDVALDAALLARAVPGRPVRLRWSREDELGRSPFGAAMLVEVSAALDDDGRIARWRQEIWSNGHTARPGRAATPVLLAGHDLAQPFPRLPAVDPPLASGGGAQRNAVPAYDIPHLQVVKNRILDQPIRTSSLRSLGALGNVLAIEGMMDELAERAGRDPVAFRLDHLSDDRARAVIETVAAMAARSGEPPDSHGRGLAFARYKNTSGYCAVVGEIDVSAEPRATRLWIAADVGEAISRDGALNQIEGGAVQTASWALKEEVRFRPEGLDCGSWEDYPILRFSEAPVVEVMLIDRPQEPPLGAGEIAHGPTAAALANAIHAALGVRMRRMPFTRERIIAAMEQNDA